MHTVLLRASPSHVLPTTVQGEMFTVARTGITVTVNGVNIETADVVSSNGVTRVIDTVLMPPSMSSGDAMTDDKVEQYFASI